MPIVTPSSDASGAFEVLHSPAGMAQVLYPPAGFPVPLPTTIAAGSNWNSGLIFAEGYRYITVTLTSTQAGSLVIQEYCDLAGTIARSASGTPFTTPIVAATPLIVDVSDLKPFVTFTVQVSNTSGSTATLSGFQLILGAG
jgi:hypothetical protein